VGFDADFVIWNPEEEFEVNDISYIYLFSYQVLIIIIYICCASDVILRLTCVRCLMLAKPP